MRNRDPHRENVENTLAICIPILTMRPIRESPSASHATRKSAWNGFIAMNTKKKKLESLIDPQGKSSVILITCSAHKNLNPSMF